MCIQRLRCIYRCRSLSLILYVCKQLLCMYVCMYACWCMYVWSWGSARLSWCDLQRFGKRQDSEDMLRRCKDLLMRFPEILKTIIGRFRGYPEEVQGSPKAVSRDFENDYILEDSEDILRRCQDLLKRFPEILRKMIYWKAPRIPWGDAKISWSDFQRFWERL